MSVRPRPEGRPPASGRPLPGEAAGPPPYPAGVRLRTMRARDMGQVVATETRSFATPWSERTFRHLLRRASARLLVAEDASGKVIGYAVVWFAGPKAELGNLAVRADWRRRGVGSRLLRAVLEETERRGASALFLEVRASNGAARLLYEQAGFKVVGRRGGYYQRPPEDALVMRLLPDAPSR